MTSALRGRRGLSAMVRAGAGAAALLSACGMAHAQMQLDPIGGLADPAPVGPPRIVPMDDDGGFEIPAYRHVCFTEGTDPRYVSMVTEVNRAYNLANAAMAPLGTDYFTVSNWPNTAIGRSVTLRWSFVPDGTQLPGLSGPTAASNLFAQMDGLFPGGRAAWISRFQQSFDRWAQLTGNTYTRVSVAGQDWDDGAGFPGSAGTATRGDVRIGMRLLDGASGVLAFNYFPTTGDMVLDSGDMTTGLFLNSANQYRFLRDVIMHEHGHGIGLAHVCSTASGNPNSVAMLMNPFINTSFDGPQRDEVRGAYSLYGDDVEGTGGNDTAATATNIGTLNIGSTINFMSTVPAPLTGANDPEVTLLALESSALVDWYAVTTSAPMAISVTVTPRGGTYLDNSQAADGSCPSTSSTNATAAQNLRITVFNSTGTTALSVVDDSSAAGVAEVLNNAILSTAGSYRIRIDRSTGNASQTQLYTLSVSGGSTTQCPTFVQQPTPSPAVPAGGSFCAGSNVTLTASATGIPTPQTVWRRNGVDVPGSVNLSSLTITNLQSGVNDGTYVMVATSTGAGCSTVLSNPITVTAAPALAFTQQPQSVTVSPPGTATFTAVATGIYDRAEWLQDGAPVQISVQPSPVESLTLTNVPAGVYSIQVRLLSAVCGNSVLSNVATLTVQAPGGCYANCDGSAGTAVLSPADFTCFLSKYRAGDTYADCDTSGGLSPADFTCFLGKYRAGCP